MLYQDGICANIGFSHFVMLYQDVISSVHYLGIFLKALEFWTWYKSIYFDSIFKNLYTCNTRFCESKYFVPFFDGQFLKCDILLVSNDPVFKP